MQGNRAGSFDRDSSSRTGYKPQPSGFRGGPSPTSKIGHSGPPPSYGYSTSSPTASGNYPNSSLYPRGRPGPPPPRYGPPPDRPPYGGEPPRNEDRREGSYPPPSERVFPPGGYDHQYNGAPDHMPPYDHPGPVISGPYPRSMTSSPRGRYDGPPPRSMTSSPRGHYDGPPHMASSPRGHYDQPPFDHARGPASADLKPLKQSRSHSSPGSADSRDGEVPPNRSAPPSHGYSEAPPSHRYPPRNGHSRAIDHHGRHTPTSYENSYPPAYGHPDYESDRRWGPSEGGHHVVPRPHHGATARGRYATYDSEDVGRDMGPSPPPPAPGRPPFSKAHQRHHSNSQAPRAPSEYSGDAYRYEDRQLTPPQEERSQQHEYEDRGGRPDQSDPGPSHEEDHASYQSHRSTDIAPSAESSQSGRGGSPTDIVSSHRDDVANMGCTCKKSKCLKLYCQCFAASVMCGPNCRCLVCHNTPRHAYARKDAIRAILARNPQAFETKFKSTNQKVAADTGGVLAHKSGCKCRKSACLKKYCECYHAGVKCSANCRCIGCQNMPPGGFGPGTRPEHSIMARSFAADVYSMKSRYEKEHGARVVGKKQGKGGEPWMVDAAQNLTFLKNASPQRPETKPLDRREGRDYPTIPSLAPSDDDREYRYAEGEVSAESGREHDQPSGTVATPEAKKPSGTPKSVNTLLMAAMAMTELHTTSSGSSPSKDDVRADPPPPEADAATPVQTPSKERKYRSPKRKSDDESSPMSQGPRPRVVFSQDAPSQMAAPRDKSHQALHDESSLMTPVDQRKMKRSRVGSVQKKGAGEDQRGPRSDAFQTRPLGAMDGTPRPQGSPSDNDQDGADTSAVEPDENEAPTAEEHTPAGAAGDVLTPVSARCIDFRHMDMNGDGKSMVQVDLNTEVSREKRETDDEKKTETMDVIASS